MTRNLIYQSRTDVILPPANPPTTVQWFAPLSEPRKIVTAAAVLIASGAILPPQPAQAAPTVPQGWFSALSQPVSVTRQFQSILAVPPQPPIIVVAPPQGWYRPLSEPYFLPQATKSRTARTVSWVFSFGTPTAPPAPPALAFFAALSQPVFAKVKYPTARVHQPSWYGVPPPVVIAPQIVFQVFAPMAKTLVSSTGAMTRSLPTATGALASSFQIFATIRNTAMTGSGSMTRITITVQEPFV